MVGRQRLDSDDEWFEREWRREEAVRPPARRSDRDHDIGRDDRDERRRRRLRRDQRGPRED